MTRQELVVRLTLYKREIYRRGLVILLCCFLPGLTTILFLGMYLGFHNSDIIRLAIFTGAIFLFILANFLAYIYTIWKSLPKKLELLCPGCRSLIMETPGPELMQTGKCAQCGAAILNLSPTHVPEDIQSATTQVASSISDLATPPAP